MKTLFAHQVQPPVLAFSSNEIIPDVFVLCVPLFITALFWFRSYTGLNRRQALLAVAGSVIACGYRAYSELRGGYADLSQMPNMLSRDKEEAFLAAFAAGAIILFIAALTLRLWGRWVGDKASAEERLPGLPGIRAWFCTSNVTVGILIVVCAWFGDDVSPLVSALGIGALLAAAPLLRMESLVSAPAPVPLTEDMSAEREKIVSMLEAGKLTVDESAELLQALGASKHAVPPKVALTGGQRLMLIGAAMVTFGFFLPWFAFNPGAEAGRMMNQMQKSLGSSLGGGMRMPGLELNTSSVSVSGGDIGHGLGWAALLLALAAALLPYLATTLEAATARTVRLLCLGVGGLIMLYLLSQNLRLAGIGLLLAVGGYALEIVGMLRDRRVVVA